MLFAPPYLPLSPLAVEIADCEIQSVHLSLTDPSFRIKSNGEIVSSTVVLVSTQGRTFSVRAQDSSGLESEMEVHLVRKKKVRLLYGDWKNGLNTGQNVC